MRLTAEQILAVQDRTIVDVEVPEWGTTVSVRSLSGAERDSLEWANYQAVKAGTVASNVTARSVAMWACKEDGSALFTLDQAEALGAKSGTALQRIYDKGAELNAIEPKHIEELAKNSEPSRADDSVST